LKSSTKKYPSVFSPEATEEEINAIIASVGQKKVYMPWIDIWVIKILPAASQEELDSKLQMLSNNPLVEMAVPSIAIPISSAQEAHPNDPYYSTHQLGSKREGHLARIYLPKAWYYERGVPQVRIGILDTGVRTTHEDIAPKLIVQYPDNTYYGDHGTAVASIAAAATNNGVGVAGVGWNISFVSGRGSTSPGALNNNLIESRLKDFLRTFPPIFAVNMSYGGEPGPGSPQSDGQKFAMLEAWRREILLVAGAGNEGAPIIHRIYPAGSAMAMPVGAMFWDRDYSLTRPDRDAEDFYYYRASYSNYHREDKGYLSVMAPGGERAYAAFAGSDADYGWFSGTSGAAPHVTGLAALVLSRFPSMSNLDLRYRLEDTADDRVRPDDATLPVSGYDRWTGWGRIDAHRAVVKTTQIESLLFPNQWHLICLPVWPVRELDETDWRDSGAAWKVFPPALNRMLYRLIPGTSQYANVTLDRPSFDYNPSVELVRPYQSFWFRFEGRGPITVQVNGAIAGLKQGHPLEVRLFRGNNMLGNPFITPLPWDDQHVRVRHYKVKKRRFLFWRKGVVESIEELPLSAAIKEGWLRDKIALWNPNSESYLYVDDNVGQSVPPMQGFFLYANRDNLTLLLKP